MGSLVLISGGAASGRLAERMLGAAPHRGRTHHIESVGDYAIGVSSADTPGRGAWMTTESGLTVAFVGQLDNRSTLASTLGLGEGADPARVVAAGLRAWGSKVATQLRGAYTFAVVDGDTALIARDHLGFRPLFYTTENGASLWATEIKQVAAGRKQGPQPNVDYLRGSLLGHGGPTSATAVAGIERMPRGSWARVEGNRIAFERYWDPTDLLETRRITVDEAAEELAEHFRSSISSVVTGDDAVALSGGIDSPLIASYAAERHLELSGNPLLAISAVFPDLPAVDETDYISSVVDRYRLRWHPYTIGARPLDDIEEWCRRLDGPGTNNSIPEIYEMYRIARSLGAHTLLTGELAEYVYAFHADLLAYLVATGRLRAAWRHATDRRRQGASWASLGRELTRSLAPSPILYGWLRRQTRKYLPPWVDFNALVGANTATDYPWAKRRWREEQLTNAIAPFADALEDVDIAAAYAGVSVRMPIASVDIWEFMLSLPAEIKYPHPRRKTLVRRAVRGIVPDQILDRQDKTFFNDHMLATAEYDVFKRLTVESPFRLEGIDYSLLSDRIESRAMGPTELEWVRLLAKTHAFVDQW